MTNSLRDAGPERRIKERAIPFVPYAYVGRASFTPENPMSADIPAPTAEQFLALTKGDETTLATVYRERYPALISIAKDSLGADLTHFSGRVVQQAMLSTWARRATFENAIGLVSFLAEAVREESTMQKKKHASLRQREGAAVAPSHITIPTADEAVAQLRATMHAPPVDHEASRAASRAAQKAHAAEHVQKVGRTGGWVVPTVLVVAVAGGLFGILKYANMKGADEAVDKALSADDARDISARRGQRGNVTLGDDSKAKLGSDSHVKVPAKFGTTMRTVAVQGAAEFTVAPGNPMPFEVRHGTTSITATGTKFSVRAYPEDSTVDVGVAEGAVTVHVKDGKEDRKLAAGAALHIAKDGTMSELTGNAKEAALSWTRDSLVFVDAPVSVVVSELVRWFDSKLSLGDPLLGSRKVTMRTSLSSSGDALKALAAAANLSVGFDKEDKVVLSDAGIQPAEKAQTKKKRK